MSGRFTDPQDPLFQALNSSIRFDYRLAPYDLEQSRAHARMLARSGIISDEDLTELERGLDAVCEEIDADTFVVAEDDEDIHMAIERRLTEIIGPVGGKLHTARSRNDQVATDVAMLVRAHSLEARELLQKLMGTLVSLAERHMDWRLPGYTHLQRAQPVYLSHHLLAYFWKFRRDLQRFNFCMTTTDDLPLGAGALAGVNFDTSRMFVAQELGFGGIAENSLDAVSNRDFVLDYLSAAATCATHLSQLGAELLRAKAPRVAAHLVALHGVLHGLPLTYNKDLQEDKEPLFDTVDTLELCLRVAAEMLEGVSFNREAMEAAASDEFIAATDVADLLVRRGVPFREAHGIVGGLVRAAVDRGKLLSELTEEELRELAPQLDGQFYELLDERAIRESKVSDGGTAMARVRDQLAQARQVLREAGG